MGWRGWHSLTPTPALTVDAAGVAFASRTGVGTGLFGAGRRRPMTGTAADPAGVDPAARTADGTAKTQLELGQLP